MASAVGLDIGTHAIKIAEVRKTRNAAALVRLGRRATPLGATKSGVIVKPKDVAAEISALLREMRLRPRNVVTAVAGQGVILRSLVMPPMGRDEMAEAVKWEVQAQIPFPVEECVYDFDIVGEVFDDSSGQAKQRVSLVAAKKEIVDSFIETLRLCKVLPKVIDVQPFSIVRSLSMRECWASILQESAESELTDMPSPRQGATGSFPVVGSIGGERLPGLDDLEHMGLEELRALAVELENGADPMDGIDPGDGVPNREVPGELDLAAETQPTAGMAAGSVRSISEDQYRLSERLVAASADNERYSPPCMVVLDIGAGTTDLVVYSKDELTFTRMIPIGGSAISEASAHAVGCSSEDAERLKQTTDWIEGTDLESGELADQLVVSAIESVVRAMAREVRRTIDFYNASHKDDPVRGGVLVGGGAKLVGLVEHLSHELGIPMVIGRPYANVSVDRKLLGTAFLEDTAPVMAVSIGLALRGVEEL